MGWSVQMLNGSLHLSKKKGAVLEAAFINKMRFPAQLLFYNIFLFQFFNLHVLEPYFISVVLQKDVTFNNISKVRPVLILGISYQCIPHFIVTVILNQFLSIQPVLYMVAFDDDHSSIELFLMERFILRSRNQVIQ
mgnify:CR=1 FL=1